MYPKSQDSKKLLLGPALKLAVKNLLAKGVVVEASVKGSVEVSVEDSVESSVVILLVDSVVNSVVDVDGSSLVPSVGGSVAGIGHFFRLQFGPGPSLVGVLGVLKHPQHFRFT